MAATNVFISGGVKREAEFLSDQDFTMGATTSATHFVELRIMTADASAVATGITIRDVRFFLEQFERLLDNGGVDGASTLLPVL